MDFDDDLNIDLHQEQYVCEENKDNTHLDENNTIWADHTKGKKINSIIYQRNDYIEYFCF